MIIQKDISGIMVLFITASLLIIHCGEDDLSPTSAKNLESVENLGDPAIIPTSPYVGGNTDAVGTSGIDDGSAARLALVGQDQYFWGDIGDGDAPIVKISHAVTDEVTDVQITFNPDFVDLTYGDGVVGWNRHTFAQLVGSDHVEVAFVNGDGDTVLHCKIDLLSPTTLVPSGYASLGVLGGDGELIKGNAEDVLSFGTSLDDNINYYGYELFQNSPATDSVFSVNPEYPNWEYYAIYRLSLSADAFGPSGFGGVHMTSVHASPSKNGEETVEVYDGPPPDDTDNPFDYTKTPEPGVPPDTTVTPVDSIPDVD